MNGETLYNAAAVMTRAGEEIEAMLEKLYALLSEELKKIEDVSEVRSTKENEEEAPNPWVLTGCLQNYSIYQVSGKKRSTPSAYLGIQIKLADEREKEVVGPQSLLYVMFSAHGSWELDEFLLSTALSEKCKLKGGWLWESYEDGKVPPEDAPWYKQPYRVWVMPLVALNTPEDLKALIVEPTKQLMQNTLDPKKMDKRILRFKTKGAKVSLA